MEKLILKKTAENEYRATIAGGLLIAAKKDSVSIPIESDDAKYINLHNTPWLTGTQANGEEQPKGIWGSIAGETFDINSDYLVIYKPMSTPPHLFAIKLPI